MVYKKYKIVAFLPRGIKISFWSGTKIIDYSDLPDAMQQQYADKIKEVKPKSVLVFDGVPRETRAPIDLKLDNPNSKAARNDYKSRKKDKDLEEDLDDKPKKPSSKAKSKNKLKSKK